MARMCVGLLIPLAERSALAILHKLLLRLLAMVERLAAWSSSDYRHVRHPCEALVNLRALSIHSNAGAGSYGTVGGNVYPGQERPLSKHNIPSGYGQKGLMPLRPVTVLAKLLDNSTPAASPPHTSARQIDLADLFLLDSSPPEGTELRQACRDLSVSYEALFDAADYSRP
ncbi:hypothetical protein Q7P35_009010 [Cladosporium inversicolor]